MDSVIDFFNGVLATRRHYPHDAKVLVMTGYTKDGIEITRSLTKSDIIDFLSNIHKVNEVKHGQGSI